MVGYLYVVRTTHLNIRRIATWSWKWASEWGRQEIKWLWTWHGYWCPDMLVAFDFHTNDFSVNSLKTRNYQDIVQPVRYQPTKGCSPPAQWNLNNKHWKTWYLAQNIPTSVAKFIWHTQYLSWTRQNHGGIIKVGYSSWQTLGFHVQSEDFLKHHCLLNFRVVFQTM